jgi:hypothetical protein
MVGFVKNVMNFIAIIADNLLISSATINFSKENPGPCIYGKVRLTRNFWRLVLRAVDSLLQYTVDSAITRVSLTRIGYNAIDE